MRCLDLVEALLCFEVSLLLVVIEQRSNIKVVGNTVAFVAFVVAVAR